MPGLLVGRRPGAVPPPFRPGGANQWSLAEAQQNFLAYGACDQRGRRFVRPPADDEPLDPAWRPIDPATDVFEEFEEFEELAGGDHRPWPDDGSALCWWLPSFRGAPEEPPHDPNREVVIDVGSARSERDLHEVLKRELGFPPFYGMNWDAFWDAATGLVEMPGRLRFVRWAELERHVPLAAPVLGDQLKRYDETVRGLSVAYEQ